MTLINNNIGRDAINRVSTERIGARALSVANIPFDYIDEANFHFYINNEIGVRFLARLKKINIKLWNLLAQSGRNCAVLNKEQKKYLFGLFNKFFVNNYQYNAYVETTSDKDKQRYSRILHSAYGDKFLTHLAKQYPSLHKRFVDCNFEILLMKDTDQNLFLVLFNRFLKTGSTQIANPPPSIAKHIARAKKKIYAARSHAAPSQAVRSHAAKKLSRGALARGTLARGAARLDGFAKRQRQRLDEQAISNALRQAIGGNFTVLGETEDGNLTVRGEKSQKVFIFNKQQLINTGNVNKTLAQNAADGLLASLEDAASAVNIIRQTVLETAPFTEKALAALEKADEDCKKKHGEEADISQVWLKAAFKDPRGAQLPRVCLPPNGQSPAIDDRLKDMAIDTLAGAADGGVKLVAGAVDCLTNPPQFLYSMAVLLTPEGRAAFVDNLSRTVKSGDMTKIASETVVLTYTVIGGGAMFKHGIKSLKLKVAKNKATAVINGREYTSTPVVAKVLRDIDNHNLKPTRIEIARLNKSMQHRRGGPELALSEAEGCPPSPHNAKPVPLGWRVVPQARSKALKTLEDILNLFKNNNRPAPLGAFASGAVAAGDGAVLKSFAKPQGRKLSAGRNILFAEGRGGKKSAPRGPENMKGRENAERAGRPAVVKTKYGPRGISHLDVLYELISARSDKAAAAEKLKTSNTTVHNHIRQIIKLSDEELQIYAKKLSGKLCNKITVEQIRIICSRADYTDTIIALIETEGDKRKAAEKMKADGLSICEQNVSGQARKYIIKLPDEEMGWYAKEISRKLGEEITVERIRIICTYFNYTKIIRAILAAKAAKTKGLKIRGIKRETSKILETTTRNITNHTKNIMNLPDEVLGWYAKEFSRELGEVITVERIRILCANFDYTEIMRALIDAERYRPKTREILESRGQKMTDMNIWHHCKNIPELPDEELGWYAKELTRLTDRQENPVTVKEIKGACVPRGRWPAKKEPASAKAAAAAGRPIKRKSGHERIFSDTQMLSALIDFIDSERRTFYAAKEIKTAKVNLNCRIKAAAGRIKRDKDLKLCMAELNKYRASFGKKRATVEQLKTVLFEREKGGRLYINTDEAIISKLVDFKGRRDKTADKLGVERNNIIKRVKKFTKKYAKMSKKEKLDFLRKVNVFRKKSKKSRINLKIIEGALKRPINRPPRKFTDIALVSVLIDVKGVRRDTKDALGVHENVVGKRAAEFLADFKKMPPGRKRSLLKKINKFRKENGKYETNLEEIERFLKARRGGSAKKIKTKAEFISALIDFKGSAKETAAALKVSGSTIKNHKNERASEFAKMKDEEKQLFLKDVNDFRRKNGKSETNLEEIELYLKPQRKSSKKEKTAAGKTKKPPKAQKGRNTSKTLPENKSANRKNSEMLSALIDFMDSERSAHNAAKKLNMSRGNLNLKIRRFTASVKTDKDLKPYLADLNEYRANRGKEPATMKQLKKVLFNRSKYRYPSKIKDEALISALIDARGRRDKAASDLDKSANGVIRRANRFIKTYAKMTKEERESFLTKLNDFRKKEGKKRVTLKKMEAAFKPSKQARARKFDATALVSTLVDTGGVRKGSALKSSDAIVLKRAKEFLDAFLNMSVKKRRSFLKTVNDFRKKASKNETNLEEIERVLRPRRRGWVCKAVKKRNINLGRLSALIDSGGSTKKTAEELKIGYKAVKYYKKRTRLDYAEMKDAEKQALLAEVNELRRNAGKRETTPEEIERVLKPKRAGRTDKMISKVKLVSVLIDTQGIREVAADIFKVKAPRISTCKNKFIAELAKMDESQKQSFLAEVNDFRKKAGKSETTLEEIDRILKVQKKGKFKVVTYVKMVSALIDAQGRREGAADILKVKVQIISGCKNKFIAELAKMDEPQKQSFLAEVNDFRKKAGKSETTLEEIDRILKVQRRGTKSKRTPAPKTKKPPKGKKDKKTSKKGKAKPRKAGKPKTDGKPRKGKTKKEGAGETAPDTSISYAVDARTTKYLHCKTLEHILDADGDLCAAVKNSGVNEATLLYHLRNIHLLRKTNPAKIAEYVEELNKNRALKKEIAVKKLPEAETVTVEDIEAVCDINEPNFTRVKKGKGKSSGKTPDREQARALSPLKTKAVSTGLMGKELLPGAARFSSSQEQLMKVLDHPDCTRDIAKIIVNDNIGAPQSVKDYACQKYGIQKKAGVFDRK